MKPAIAPNNYLGPEEEEKKEEKKAASLQRGQSLPAEPQSNLAKAEKVMGDGQPRRKSSQVVVLRKVSDYEAIVEQQKES